MSFFKHNPGGERNRRIARMEQLIWVLIYGGLLAIVLGYFMESTQGGDPTELYAIGSLVTALGVVMIFARSRMSNDKDLQKGKKK